MKALALLLIAAMLCCGQPGGQHVSVEMVNGRLVVQNVPIRAWATVPQGHMVEELRIGAAHGDTPDVFGAVTALAVSKAGEIAILDGQAKVVRIFDHNGAYVRTVGHAGSGPGEFRTPLSIHYDQSGRLWVVDVGKQRYEVFGRTGNYIRGTPRSAGLALGDPGRYTTVGLFDPTPRITLEGKIQLLYVLVDSEGLVADTAAPIAEGDVARLQNVPAALAPFLPLNISSPGPRGDIWIASTDGYTVFCRTLDGDTVRVIKMTVPAPELSAEQRDSIDSAIRRWPHPVNRSSLGLGPQVLRGLQVGDDGRLFVRPSEPEKARGSVFDAFDQEGRFVGRIVSDVAFADRPPVVFKGGAAYGVVLDTMDIPYVVRARVELPHPQRDEGLGGCWTLALRVT